MAAQGDPAGMAEPRLLDGAAAPYSCQPGCSPHAKSQEKLQGHEPEPIGG